MVTEAAPPKLIVLDPSVEPLPVEATLAPRPDTLNGKVIGLMSNGKHNADKLLDELQALLAEHYDFARVVRAPKHNPTIVADSKALDELAAECDVFMTAIGD